MILASPRHWRWIRATSRAPFWFLVMTLSSALYTSSMMAARLLEAEGPMKVAQRSLKLERWVPLPTPARPQLITTPQLFHPWDQTTLASVAPSFTPAPRPEARRSITTAVSRQAPAADLPSFSTLQPLEMQQFTISVPPVLTLLLVAHFLGTVREQAAQPLSMMALARRDFLPPVLQTSAGRAVHRMLPSSMTTQGL